MSSNNLPTYFAIGTGVSLSLGILALPHIINDHQAQDKSAQDKNVIVASNGARCYKPVPADEAPEDIKELVVSNGVDLVGAIVSRVSSSGFDCYTFNGENGDFLGFVTKEGDEVITQYFNNVKEKGGR